MRVLITVECIAVVLLLVLCAYKNQLPDAVNQLFGKEKYDVVLDAGHGGYDTGANSGDLLEKDITLEMVKEIGAVLEANGYKVKYIRDSDDVSWADNESEDLRYRAETVNKSGAKLFVSLHVNSEDYDQGTYGYEAWGKLKDEKVFRFAKHILDNVSSLGYSQNRGMKDQDLSPLYVLGHADMPAVLFEVGFIASEQDQQHMKAGSMQKEFCKKIAEGIMDTLKEEEKFNKKDTD